MDFSEFYNQFTSAATYYQDGVFTGKHYVSMGENRWNVLAEWYENAKGDRTIATDSGWVNMSPNDINPDYGKSSYVFEEKLNTETKGGR